MGPSRLRCPGLQSTSGAPSARWSCVSGAGMGQTQGTHDARLARFWGVPARFLLWGGRRAGRHVTPPEE